MLCNGIHFGNKLKRLLRLFHRLYTGDRSNVSVLMVLLRADDRVCREYRMISNTRLRQS